MELLLELKGLLCLSADIMRRIFFVLVCSLLLHTEVLKHLLPCLKGFLLFLRFSAVLFCSSLFLQLYTKKCNPGFFLSMNMFNDLN